MSDNKFKENMKSKFSIGLSIAFMGMVSLSSCERIDAGHEGIKVSLYGDDKGVGEAALVTGRVWYNPFTTEIYEYPAYVRILEKMWIEKWDGKLPVYGQVPTIFKDISK